MSKPLGIDFNHRLQTQQQGLMEITVRSGVFVNDHWASPASNDLIDYTGMIFEVFFDGDKVYSGLPSQQGSLISVLFDDTGQHELMLCAKGLGPTHTKITDNSIHKTGFRIDSFQIEKLSVESFLNTGSWNLNDTAQISFSRDITDNGWARFDLQGRIYRWLLCHHAT